MFFSTYQHLIYLDSIKYGLWDCVENAPIFFDDPKFHNLKIQDSCIKVLSPKEVMKYKIGTCYETALLNYFTLKEYNPKVFYIDVNYERAGEDVFRTHLGTYIEFDSYYWWIESSWYIYRGLHGPYKEPDEIFDTLVALYKNTFKSDDLFLNKDFNADSILSTKIVHPSNIIEEGHCRSNDYIGRT